MALIGMDGVIAYSVAQPTQEVAIRRAFGAPDIDILQMVVGQGLALTFAGIGLGIVAALELSRFMTSLLFHTSLFILVASAASYIPARNTARIGPMKAIRN